ncbi:hypothetical protein NM688_g6468 [Phlebia brevispora]|uniref:Uncharacterized protein n=1 Tax=Phlebia brevispora TaxID=194682 RepID=A0ACC1SFU6_9APHY|nr:hypothetical protein NM688_g6468 [Phlebia brevispora]
MLANARTQAYLGCMWKIRCTNGKIAATSTFYISQVASQCGFIQHRACYLSITHQLLTSDFPDSLPAYVAAWLTLVGIAEDLRPPFPSVTGMLNVSIENDVSQQNLNNFCQVAACTLYVYNVCLTLEAEVTHVWKHISRPVPRILVAMKYLGLANNVLAVFMALTKMDGSSIYRGELIYGSSFHIPKSDPFFSCTGLVILGVAFDVLIYSMGASFAVLHMHGLNGCRGLARLMGLSVLSIYMFISLHSEALVPSPPLTGCMRNNSLPLSVYTKRQFFTSEHGFRCKAYCHHTSIGRISHVPSVGELNSLETGQRYLPYYVETRQLSIVKHTALVVNICLASRLGDASSDTYLSLVMIITVVQAAIPQTSAEFNPLQNIFEALNTILLLNFLVELQGIGQHTESESDGNNGADGEADLQEGAGIEPQLEPESEGTNGNV